MKQAKLSNWKRAGNALILAGLLLGLSFIAGLKRGRASQHHELVEQWEEQRRAAIGQIFPRENLPSVEVEMEGYHCYLAEKPVSNRQFHYFVQSTGYLSWRERQGKLPDWRRPERAKADKSHSAGLSWEEMPEAPVRWLNQSDAIEYCRWLAKERKERSPYVEGSGGGEEEALWFQPGLRLPRAEELEAITSAVDINGWEWTCQTLFHFDPQSSRHQDYCTAWRLSEKTLDEEVEEMRDEVAEQGPPLRHRRESDMGWSDSQPTGFRLAWTRS